MACPGVYKPSSDENSPGKCYTYDVLTAICIEVGPVVDVDSVE
jgi:hypothetical protein